MMIKRSTDLHDHKAGKADHLVHHEEAFGERPAWGRIGGGWNDPNTLIARDALCAAPQQVPFRMRRQASGHDAPRLARSLVTFRMTLRLQFMLTTRPGPGKPTDVGSEL